MSETPAQLAILNRAFIRLYRSLGQYVREAWPEFDLDETVIRQLIDRQADDVRQLGGYIVDQHGSIETGAYPHDYEDLHFVNASRIIERWTAAQKQLIAAIETDRKLLGQASTSGVTLLDEIIAHERDSVSKLQRLTLTAAVPA